MATVQIDKLLETVVKESVSDLHITTGQPPVVRVGGRMVRLETKSLEPDDTVALMKSITPERNQQELQEVGGTDFGFAFGEHARFRVSVFKQRGHISMVLRRIPNEFLTFEQLGLPTVITDLLERPRGLFLVTGPTGSGKTTSLASMINYMNDTMDHHIITMEDPIEYYHQHKKSTINQREIGVDVPSFPEALRRALRQDPDVILVGEMRDLETISAAITAAETGHVVFGTLHTTGAQGTVDRIIDVFPTNQQEQIRTQLSTSIIGILSQALMPKKPKGLVAAYEMLVVTPAIANLIREAKTYRINSSIQTGRKFGMQLLDDALFNLWKDGLCEEKDVVMRSNNPGELKAKIAMAKKGLLEDGDEDDEDFEDYED
ncbi:MAG: type IV pilus twitching motility protein PilT [Planctomycetes bacterium]|nr:type IV pilus twitching motility protein PilT [Planctomycetota bacterium]MCH9726328.1 type IV pilus twitching motility protein PilT [Planctomycetota bacterium]MCH9778882.1 type IV pilus twitching motility protein PilT [Planctomycetota bacterium]MCH9792680.1 type IV pilus twitching motility protein PilT [Planctomycetota bacterium]MDF1744876.1 type IV pilus twitching motility protein PilT [Gimesia sp.]